VATTLRHLVSGKPHICGPDASLADAARAMAESGPGSLGVIDGRRLVGVLTERDLVRALAAGTDVTVTPVEAYMSADPDTFGPDTNVVEAAGWIAEYGYRHLPVVEEGALLGIVSVRDLLRAVVSGS
jgi:CBS domain-containing protein